MPSKFLSNGILRDLLSEASTDERLMLTGLLGENQETPMGGRALQEKICESGGHGVVNFFRGQGTSYLDILDDIVNELDIPGLPPYTYSEEAVSYCVHAFEEIDSLKISKADSIQMGIEYAQEAEGKILLRHLEVTYEKMDPKQKIDFELHFDSIANDLNISLFSGLTGVEKIYALSGMQDELRYSMLKGIFLPLITSDPTASFVSPMIFLPLLGTTAFLGPVAWGGVGIAAIFAYGKPKYQKLIPVVVAIGFIRQRIYSKGNITQPEITSNETKVRNLSTFISKVGEKVASGTGEKIRSEAGTWLEDKKSKYSGNEYIKQLEKNAIYAVESVHVSLSSLVTFIITEIDLSPEFINNHIGNGKKLARDKVGLHLNYLNDNCSSCVVHKDHERYVGLKDLKNSGDIEKYIDELEFWCLLYRAMQTFTISYISLFMSNTNKFKVFGGLDEEVIRREVEAYIKFYTNECIGNLDLAPA